MLALLAYMNVLAQAAAADNWFDKINKASGLAKGSLIGVGVVIAILMIVRAAIKMTLGAILGALITASIVVYGTANITDLGKVTQDTFEMNAPAPVTAQPFVGAAFTPPGASREAA